MNTRIEVNEDVRSPQSMGDLLARDQLSGALDQQQQHIHWLTRQPHATPRAPQVVGGDVEFAVAKSVGHAIR